MRRTSASRGGDGNRGRRRSKRGRRAILGDWNIISDYSGQKILASESKETWEGWIVHESEWEPKHPQLDLRGRDEQIGVPFSRPRKPDKFGEGSAEDL